MAKSDDAYSLAQPFSKVFPQPVISNRNPSTSDKNYPLGQVWVNKASSVVYMLASVSAGSATWAVASPGTSEVDSLGGDSGTDPVVPLAGKISLTGGTNLATVGGTNEITFNLDDAISLATSVTSPLYTSGAGVDMSILAAAGQDVIMTLGDSAGANSFIVEALDGTDVWTIASDGTMTFSSLTVTGAFAQTGGTFDVGQDNAANAISIGGGTVARAIALGNGTGAHTIAIGAATAGAITVDTAAGVSIGAATASDFTVTGAGQDLTLAAAGGSVAITSTENAASAISLVANGGTTETILIRADQGAGADSISLTSDDGGVTLTAGLASADAINLSATAGGVDIDGALQVNIASSQAAGDAVRIVASAGGIDVDAVGSAGVDINVTNTGGSLNLSATEDVADAIVINATTGGIDITADGAAASDLDLTCTNGSVNVVAGEADAAAISLQAASGGLDIDTGLAIIADAAGNVEINSSAGQLLFGNDDVDQNAGFATDGVRVVTVGSTNGAASLVLQAGTGGITMTGTVESITTKQLITSGLTTTFKASPTTCTAANTGGAATGATGATNLLGFADGFVMEQFIIGAGQTIIKPTMDTSGLLCSLDLTNTEGVEYNFGAARTLSPFAFTIGTDAAFFFEVTMTLADISGGDPYIIGFRKAAANNGTYTAYTDYYALGMNATTSATNLSLISELNGGGTTLQDSGTAWTGGDGGTVTMKVLVSAAGVVTATIDGGAPATPLAYTFDSTDVVCPFIHLVHNADAGAIHLVDMSVGFQ